MNSGIEKFIKRHREEFDDAHPSPGVWNQIEKSVPGTTHHKKSSLHFLIKRTAVAASILIVAVSLYVLIDRYSHEKPVSVTGPAAKEATDPTGHIADSDYAVLLTQASREVENRLSSLQKTVEDFPELRQRFDEDLKRLDSTYQLLKSQAAQSINPEVILQAMIKNLQLQAELLTRQLMIINEFKITKNPAHEKDI